MMLEKCDIAALGRLFGHTGGKKKRYLLEHCCLDLHQTVSSMTGELPSGKHPKNYGKSPFLMGKSTMSMAMFNSYFDITRGYSH